MYWTSLVSNSTQEALQPVAQQKGFKLPVQVGNQELKKESSLGVFL